MLQRVLTKVFCSTCLNPKRRTPFFWKLKALPKHASTSVDKRMSVLEKEDWKSVIDLVTNTKQVVSSIQDVVRKVAHYAQFRGKTNNSDAAIRKDPVADSCPVEKDVTQLTVPEELFIPGSVYCLRRNINPHITGGSSKSEEYFTLWKRHPGEHFQRIVLSNNLISDHKCDSHYYALRDVLKGAPYPPNFRELVKTIFKRLFRVYAHIYHSHFQKIVTLKEEPHLN